MWTKSHPISIVHQFYTFTANNFFLPYFPPLSLSPCSLQYFFSFLFLFFPFLGSLLKISFCNGFFKGMGKLHFLLCLFYIFPSYHLPNPSFQVSKFLLFFFFLLSTFFTMIMYKHHMPLSLGFLLFFPNSNRISHCIYWISLFFIFSQNLGKFGILGGKIKILPWGFEK